jgi:hypothetical protein
MGDTEHPHPSAKSPPNPHLNPFLVPLNSRLPLGFGGTQARIVALIGFKGV